MRTGAVEAEAAGLSYWRIGLSWGSRARLGEGEDDLNLKEPSPPLFIRVLNSRRVISTKFRYYSEFGPNLPHHLQIEFSVFKY